MCIGKVAPHVPSPLGPRDSTSEVPYGQARRYNPVEPLEVNQPGHSKRSIATLRISTSKVNRPKSSFGRYMIYFPECTAVMCCPMLEPSYRHSSQVADTPQT